MITGKYPNLRLRRSRKYSWSRKLVQESSLSYSDLILPIFLIEGKNKKESIKSMPNVFRYSIDKLNTVVGKAIKKGTFEIGPNQACLKDTEKFISSLE